MKRLGLAILFLFALGDATAARRRFVPSPTSTAAPTPIDLILDFETGTAGDAITPTNLLAATHSTAPGTYSYSDSVSALLHTKITGSNLASRTPYLLNGSTTYTGSGTRSELIDMTGRAGSVGVEGWWWNVSGTYPDLSVAAEVIYSPVQDPTHTNPVQIDTFDFSSTSFSVAQLYWPASGSQIYVRSHGDPSVGGTAYGRYIPIVAGTHYKMTLRNNTTDQLCEAVWTDGTTGALVGTSCFPSSVSAPSIMTVHDYLLSFGGTIQIDNIAIDWTNAALPLEPFATPAVTSVTATQTDVNTVTVTWDAPSLRYKLEKSVNAGSYTTLQAARVASIAGTVETYVDSGLTNGSTYTYRVTPKIGSNVGPSTISNAITIDNSALLPPVTSGLLAQYRANLLTLADGDLVSTWPDTSSNANDLVAAGSVQSPVFKTGIINGKPVVRFDGSANYLTGTISGWGAAREIFVIGVKRSAPSTTTKGLMGFSFSANNCQVFSNTTYAANYGYYAPLLDLGGGSITTAHVVDMSFASLSSATFAVNGAAGTTFDPDDTYAGTDFVLGALQPSVDFGDWDIALVLVYDHVLSGADRTTLLNAFKSSSGNYGYNITAIP